MDWSRVPIDRLAKLQVQDEVSAAVIMREGKEARTPDEPAVSMEDPYEGNPRYMNVVEHAGT
jgi:hypothetical protein